jgi:superfamily II DNA or RNA helicase
VPRSERRPADPALCAALAETPEEYQSLLARLSNGRLVFAGTNAPGAVWLPRGLLAAARKVAPVEIPPGNDRRLAFPRLDYAWRSQLDLPQYAAVYQVVAKGGGILKAPPGGGKTRLAWAAASAWGQPVAWITHRKDLADGAAEEFFADFNLPGRALGYIGAGHLPHFGTHATIAMIQALAKSPQLARQLSSRVGAVIVDEAHHSAAASFARVIQLFPAAYRLGVSATPDDRQDGLSSLIRAIFGSDWTEIADQALIRSGRIMGITVHLIDSGYVHHGKRDWGTIERSRARSEGRNAVLCSIGVREFRRGHKVLILVHLREHAALLADMLLHRYGLPAAAVDGNTPSPERRRVYREFEAGYLILCCTSVADEGLNLPAMDRFVLGAAAKAPGLLKQQIGRVARAWRGKQDARAFDVVDLRVEELREHAAIRAEVYREKGWRIEAYT